MNQVLKSFLHLKRLFSADIPAEYLTEFREQVTDQNLKRLFALSTVTFFAAIMLLSVDIFVIPERQVCSANSLYCKALVTAHSIILGITGLYILLILLLRKKGILLAFKRFALFISVNLTLLLFVGITAVGFLAHQSMVAYIMGAFVVGSLFTLVPVTALITFLINISALFAVITDMKHDPAIITAAYLNSTMATIFAYTVSVMLYRHRRNVFLKEKIIEEQTKDLELSEKYSSKVFESSPNPKVIVAYPEGNVLVANEEARAFFEIPAGSEAVDVLATDYYADLKDRDKYLKQINDHGRLRGFEIEIITYKGNRKFCTVSAEKIEYYHRPAVIIGFADITERQKQQLALAAAKEEAEKSSQHKSDFLANMSHEIRTPMNAIMGISELLSESPLNKDQNRLVKILSNASENLIRILNDILDVSKMNAGALNLEIVTFNLGDLVDQLREIYRYRSEKHEIEILFKTDPDLPDCLRGDPHRLTQILRNLIGNALKFTEKGSIHIEISGTTDHVEKKAELIFIIRDTGIGIAEDKIDSLFERFMQAENSTTRKYGGTGLGLTICRELTVLMGGSITVESEPGKGSTFTVNIPFEISGETADDYTPTGQPEETLQSTPGKKILVAEDSADNRLLIERFLAGEPVKIVFAVNGSAAVEKFRSEKFDLILMDIQMPVMDGYTALNKIREIEQKNRTEPVPVIALTAYAFNDDIKRAHEAGFSGHLAKPFSKKDIIRCVTDNVKQAG